MKTIILTFLFAFSSFVYGAEETITSTTRPTQLSPTMVTGFDDFILQNTYVSVVSTLIGGAWLSQQISINVGYQEEGQETFETSIIGEIIGVRAVENYDDSITVTVITALGSFNNNMGAFNEGITEYVVTITRDENTDHGYASDATLARIVYDK